MKHFPEAEHLQQGIYSKQYKDIKISTSLCELSSFINFHHRLSFKHQATPTAVMSHIRILFAIYLMIMTQPTHSFPISPCASSFTYRYDGQWFGVIHIPSYIYNRSHANYIRLNVTFIINRHIPPMQNLRLLDLMHSLPDTLRDKAAGRPIVYRISFPFQDILPTLLHMHVNGVMICANQQQMYGLSKIELQHTFYLPSIAYDDNISDYYDSLDSIDDDDDDEDLKRMITDDLPPTTMQQRDSSDEDKMVCGTQHKSLRYSHLISGGDRILPGSWPWIVGIFHKDPNSSDLSFLCTGSLISNRAVVTAAHCFQKFAATEIVLAFGRHDLRDWTDKNMRLSNVEEIHTHPDYLKRKRSNAFDADVAVLIAKDFINFTARIRPVCLWPPHVDDTLDIIGVNGTMVGWGQPVQNVATNLARRLELPIVELRHCSSKGRVRRNQRIFCAGNASGGRAPCQGDSGSGLAIWVNGAWYLRGVVSAALGDPTLNRCNLNTYVIFSDMVYFDEWLNSFL